MLVQAPSAAVPSAAMQPSLPGRGRMPRWAGSPSALAGKGRLGRPPYPLLHPCQLLLGSRCGGGSDALANDILRSALASSSWAADVVADQTPLPTSTVARGADLEDDATMEQARRNTSSAGIHPTPNNNNNMRQLVLLRANGFVGPDPLPPASSLSPLPLPLPPLRQQQWCPTSIA